tara:strand:+ start:40 stop:309 length:270 start_codon:yes stop_codon:yes gene_type:complete
MQKLFQEKKRPFDSFTSVRLFLPNFCFSSHGFFPAPVFPLSILLQTLNGEAGAGELQERAGFLHLSFFAAHVELFFQQWFIKRRRVEKT